MRSRRFLLATLLLAIVPFAAADFVVDYTVDLGGKSGGPLNGLAARGTFSLSGSKLSILLENTSTGVPSDFDTAASLLVSLGMNLPAVDFLSGDIAMIGPGSVGLGAWDGRVAGDGVAEEWLWTNDFGGDYMAAFKHVLSTSNGQGGGSVTGFGGHSFDVDGPFGGIAAAPPVLEIPKKQPAVSDSIRFELTLTGTLTPAQLQAVAQSSIVEFGSDQRYLGVPEPTAFGLIAAGALILCRRR